MFGYVLPDKNYLMLKDYALYQSVYCGICKSTKELFGNLPRIATNYDSVFLSILAHNLANVDFTIEKQTCILHPFKKRNMSLPDEISKKIATLNVLLLYHKLEDDVTDDGSLKYSVGKRLFTRAYEKAKELQPEYNEIISEQYNRLREFEKAKSDSFDRVSDCFGVMMQKLCEKLTGETSEDFSVLCYNIGRWIYLIDALDDLEKDQVSGNYNVFLCAYGGFASLEWFINEHREEIEFALLSSVGVVKERADKLQFHFNADIIKNITHRGLSVRTKILLENDCKCKKIRM